MITMRLISKANKLIIPIPPFSKKEMWKASRYHSRRAVLKPNGIAELRKKIRNEQRDRRDVYLPWIVVTTGLIAALTGLLAVILR